VDEIARQERDRIRDELGVTDTLLRTVCLPFSWLSCRAAAVALLD